jgi:hypothetical protein
MRQIMSHGHRYSDNRQTRPDSRTTRERPEHSTSLADGIRGDTLHLEGSVNGADSGVAPTDLGVRLQYQLLTNLGLGPDVLHTHEASVDLGRLMLRLGDQKCHCGAPSLERIHPSFRIKHNSQVVAIWCGRVAAMRLKGPLGTVDILSRTCTTGT